MSTFQGTTMHADVVLENEGSMVQNCWNINEHVVDTDIIMLKPTWMFMDKMRKQTYQWAQYKQKKKKKKIDRRNIQGSIL